MDLDLLPAERAALVKVARLTEARKVYPFRTLFPETGPLRRELYPRSMTFFAAGRLYRERLFLAANRVGKTVAAAYETTAHLTGDYPDWWPGRKYEGPIEMWAVGETFETTRDIVQLELCGAREALRAGRFTGMIPGHLVVDHTKRSGGVADCVDTLWVRHKEKVHGAPATSTLQFKAYNQGRNGFQGTKKKVIWLDEEPPDASEDPGGGGTPSGNGDIYTECLLRTSTEEDGMLMATLTPLRGLTPFVDRFLESSDMADADGRITNAKTGIFGKAQ